MTSIEIYEKLKEAELEYHEANSKLIDSNYQDDDLNIHVMYLMGRMHALDEIYTSACLKEDA